MTTLPRWFRLAFLALSAAAVGIVLWRFDMAIPVVALPVQGEPVGEEELLDGREPSTVYDRHREHLRRGERHP